MYSVDNKTMYATYNDIVYPPKSVDGIKQPLSETECAEKERQAALIQAATDALNATAYARSRAAEYPSIGDQLDALFHAGVFPEDMAAKIQAVKDKYPKGGAA